MADTFANARLLTIFAYGHVLAQQTSTRASNYLSGYFINAALPPQGNVVSIEPGAVYHGRGLLNSGVRGTLLAE